MLDGRLSDCCCWLRSHRLRRLYCQPAKSALLCFQPYVVRASAICCVVSRWVQAALAVLSQLVSALSLSHSASLTLEPACHAVCVVCVSLSAECALCVWVLQAERQRAATVQLHRPCVVCGKASCAGSRAERRAG